MRLCQDPRFASEDGLPAWPPRDTGSPLFRKGAPTSPSATSGATLDDVCIVRPYTLSRHLMLTLSNRGASWKMSLRLEQPVHIPVLHEFLLANVGRTIAEIGELEFQP